MLCCRAADTPLESQLARNAVFWSYCGLGIVTRSSSDRVQATDGGWIKALVPQTRGLSRQHNHFLKSIFKGAATTVITQRNKDPIYGRHERLLDGDCDLDVINTEENFGSGSIGLGGFWYENPLASSGNGCASAVPATSGRSHALLALVLVALASRIAVGDRLPSRKSGRAPVHAGGIETARVC